MSTYLKKACNILLILIYISFGFVHLAGQGEVSLFGRSSIYSKKPIQKHLAFSTLKLPRHIPPSNLSKIESGLTKTAFEFSAEFVIIGISIPPESNYLLHTDSLILSNKAPPCA